MPLPSSDRSIKGQTGLSCNDSGICGPVVRRQSGALAENKVRPTLEATAGNLIEEVPGTDITVLLEFLERLEQLLDTPLSNDTLLYGMDGKFYAPMLSTSRHL